MKNSIKKLLVIELCVCITIIVIYLIIKSDINLQCYVENKYGILCPSCGGTRMAMYILTGHMAKAFMMHPIFFMGILYLCFFNIMLVINSFKENETCKWIYPKMIYLIIFIIALLVFTIIRNVI